MKKSLFFCSALAVLALVSGCKKDQEMVTLGVSLEQNSKVYIDNNRYPCWSEGDQVYVNSGAYMVTDISPDGRIAQVTVPACSSGYTAVFPASIVTRFYDFPNTNWEATDGYRLILVYLPKTQEYEVVNGKQKVELPMVATASSTNLAFTNCGSILRVAVSNATDHSSLDIYKIVVSSDEDKEVYLSGSSVIDLDGNFIPGYRIISMESKSVTLAKENNTAMATIAASSTTPTTFDIVLPAFGLEFGGMDASSKIYVRVETNQGNQEFETSNEVSLPSNQIVTFNASVDDPVFPPAELKSGWNISSFLDVLSDDNSITSVSFVCNDPTTSSTELQVENTPTKIYGRVSGDTYIISTPVDQMNANADCIGMFGNLSQLTSISFGEGFNTSNVEDMMNMFAGCTGLTSITGLTYFNTANVTDMRGMFSGCKALTSLNLSSFITENVTNMNGMFSGCGAMAELHIDNFAAKGTCDWGYICTGMSSSLTGDNKCEIYCTSQVETDLSGTDFFPTDKVHFNIVTGSK